jgi:AraC-like DNA-binding protein
MGERLPLHTHEAAVVLLPLTRLVVFGRRIAVPVGPGDVWFANPLELYGASKSNGSWQARALLLSPDLLRRVAPAGETPTVVLSRAVGGPVREPALTHALATLCAELDRPAISSQTPTELVELLRELMRRPAENMSGPRNERGNMPGIARAQTHLQAHVAHAVSLDELAAVAFMSKSYLVREFHRAIGLPPHAYQVQLRVARAAALLAAGAPLSRAAFDAGFADQSHMSRKFKSAYGITPLQFARGVRGGPPAQPLGCGHTRGYPGNSVQQRRS